MIDKLVEEGKLEDGVSAWSIPSFPVPKKKPGEYRLVVDYRLLKEATVTDTHPLPRIEEILQRQGRFRVWSVLDMKDGFHQVPLKKEHRPLSCMTICRETAHQSARNFALIKSVGFLPLAFSRDWPIMTLFLLGYEKNY